jgi:hypothetical protein
VRYGRRPNHVKQGAGHSSAVAPNQIYEFGRSFLAIIPPETSARAVLTLRTPRPVTVDLIKRHIGDFVSRYARHASITPL